MFVNHRLKSKKNKKGRVGRDSVYVNLQHDTTIQKGQEHVHKGDHIHQCISKDGFPSNTISPPLVEYDAKRKGKKDVTQ